MSPNPQLHKNMLAFNRLHPQLPQRHNKLSTPDWRFGQRYNPATSLWSWGFNHNYVSILSLPTLKSLTLSIKVLGHPDSDNRSYPERVEIPRDSANLYTITSLEKREMQITGVMMSKYHMCVLANGTLLVNGFGQGGRLGLANEKTTLQPTHVLSGVKAVALGHDHTVAVLESGKVWTWGSNKFGVLGFPTEIVGNEPEHVLEPMWVAGSIKKIRFVGVAASKYHTVVYSDKNILYSWGYSVGQLGYPHPKNTIHTYPRKIPLSLDDNTSIISVSATSHATVVLLETQRYDGSKSTELHVYNQSEWQRVYIPKVRLLVAGLYIFAAVTEEGDVYCWAPESDEYRDSWAQNSMPQRKPKKVWEAKGNLFAATGVAVGMDASLLVLTASGHVYFGKRREENVKNADKIYKYTRLPNLQNIVSITASSSGACAALRNDTRPIRLKPPPPTFLHDLGNFFQACNTVFPDPFADLIFNCTDGHVHAHCCVLQTHNLAIPTSTTTSVNCNKATLILGLGSVYTAATTSSEPAILAKILGISNSFTYHTNAQLLVAWRDRLLLADNNADVEVQLADGVCRAHRTVLVARSGFFDALLGPTTAWSCDIADGHWVVRLLHLDKAWVDVVMRFMYGFVDDADEDEDGVIERLFKGERTETQWVEFLVDILAVADELLVDGLKRIVSCLLGAFIDIVNVVDIWKIANWFMVKELENACLEFMAWNLETLIQTKRLLRYVDLENQNNPCEPVILDLENTLKSLQDQKLPFVRSFYASVKLKAQKAEDTRKQLRRAEYERRNNQRQLSTLSNSAEVQSLLIGSIDKFSELKESPQKSIDALSVSFEKMAFFPMSIGSLCDEKQPELSTSFVSVISSSVGSLGSLDGIPEDENEQMVPETPRIEETMFDFELDGTKMKEQNRIQKKKGWKKLDLTEESEKILPSNTVAKPPVSEDFVTKGWAIVNNNNQRPKQSLREIMQENNEIPPLPISPDSTWKKHSPKFPIALNEPTQTPKKSATSSQSPTPKDSATSSISIRKVGLSQRERRIQQKVKVDPPSPPLPEPSAVWGKSIAPAAPLTWGKSVIQFSQTQPPPLFSSRPATPSLLTPSLTKRTATTSKIAPHLYPPLGASLVEVPSERINLRHIQEEELVEKERISRIKRSRPLVDVQKEERAVKQLMEYYAMTREPGS
ncbi:hypothetical protein HK096_004730, partial [Nowakowskiella sp. JEL0078]